MLVRFGEADLEMLDLEPSGHEDGPVSQLEGDASGARRSRRPEGASKRGIDVGMVMLGRRNLLT